MNDVSRRSLFFVAALIGGVGLLVALMLLLTRPPRTIAPTARPAATKGVVVATVNDEPIGLEEWGQAVALDQAMSALVGQPPPSSEETLDRLINQRLVLKAAAAAELPVTNQVQAEVWLAEFLSSWGLDDATLDRELSGVGLTRADLVDVIVPRLLLVEQALGVLPPDGDADAWLADLRNQAQVEILTNLSISITPSTPELAPQATKLSTGPRVGEQAPDLSLLTVDGARVSLAGLRGRPVLLNFWATWCAPCREELPWLQTIHESDPDGVVVLAIAVRESAEAVTAFATELELEIPLLLDQDGQIGAAYHVHGLPTSLFIDRDGLIAARHVGPLDQSALDGYLIPLLDASPGATPAP